MNFGKVLVTGSGGFIGHHLVTRLKRDGYWVRGVDIKAPEYEPSDADQFWGDCDLRKLENCTDAVDGIDTVFNLAADMGGIGYITAHHATITRNNTLIGLNMLEEARVAGVKRFLFSSSACIYPQSLQQSPDVTPLREEDAWPADPEKGYGLEKLFTEELCRYYREDFGMETRIVRFHNVYGPCFDSTTEVLTKQGWKFFADVSDSDEIATRNPEGFLEYHRPLARQAYDYDGPMYRLSHPAADSLVTPDHQLFYAFPTTGYRRGVKGERGTDIHAIAPFRLGAAKDSNWTRSRMYFSCHVKWHGTDRAHFELPTVRMTDGRGMDGRGGAGRFVNMDDWLTFVGWFLSEGSAFTTPSNYTVTLAQNPGPRQDEITAVLHELGFKYSIYKDPGNQIVVSSKQLYEAVQPFGKGATNKVLPREYLDLPPSRLAVLWDSLMAGDGDVDGHRYSTVSKQLADSVMEIALKLGLRAKIYIEARDDNPAHNPMYRVAISPHTRLDTRRAHRTMEHYKGRVYDLTVPNHIMLVRRNGKAMWSGNCGSWTGGKEKSPAAICRKIAEVPNGGTIEVWGDGLQTRSYMHVGDCVEGLIRLMASDYREPLNLGTDRLVTINELVDIVAKIAGKQIGKRHDLTKPQGVRGRNSDNSRLRAVLGWEPSISLEKGLARTYPWIEQQVKAAAELERAR